MVNSKKMSKSTVAIVLLSLLLVLSLILTATGAWFTSGDKTGDGDNKVVNMGKVQIALSDTTAMAVQYGSKNGEAVVEKMVDKDTLTVTYGINNTSDVDIYYVIKAFNVKVYDYSTGEKGAELPAYEEYFGIADQFAASETATKLENGADVEDATVTLTFDSNGAANVGKEGVTVTAIYVELNLEVAAIQAAHVASASEAYGLLTA